MYLCCYMLSITEENYLKGILHLTAEKEGGLAVGTNLLAASLGVRPATATDMLKKLKDKQLVDYQRYGKIRLTDLGRSLATGVIRKHRLWETFLFDKLGFTWDEVHEVAEQLEHIQSDQLIERLDKFLGYPKFDPHGDVIPVANGQLKADDRKTLGQARVGKEHVITGVRDSNPDFLQYASQLGIAIEKTIAVIKRHDFDNSLEVNIDNRTITVSEKVGESIFIK